MNSPSPSPDPSEIPVQEPLVVKPSTSTSTPLNQPSTSKLVEEIHARKTLKPKNQTQKGKKNIKSD